MPIMAVLHNPISGAHVGNMRLIILKKKMAFCKLMNSNGTLVRPMPNAQRHSRLPIQMPITKLSHLRI